MFDDVRRGLVHGQGQAVPDGFREAGKLRHAFRELSDEPQVFGLAREGHEVGRPPSPDARSRGPGLPPVPLRSRAHGHYAPAPLAGAKLAMASASEAYVR